MPEKSKSKGANSKSKSKGSGKTTAKRNNGNNGNNGSGSGASTNTDASAASPTVQQKPQPQPQPQAQSASYGSYSRQAQRSRAVYSTSAAQSVGREAKDRKPTYRSLRGYAFDPSLSLKIETAAINEITYRIPWEPLDFTSGDGTQGAGPVGEYIEVIDFDPTVKRFYAPVDLNEKYPLAMQGLDPSEGNPQFHQQMVYAVTMTTIKNFETALGRQVLWAPRRKLVPAPNGQGTKIEDEYVQRLRVYPHALREANAYYSPLKKALLFGYFSARPVDITLHMPDALTFTCLSHDIVAHETTHAILDGMFPYYNEASNADVLAFHEAFSDIVALFQHFTFPEVLKHQIKQTRGDLASQNLLGQLAQEFGSAIGGYGSLRDAIGRTDPATGEWIPAEPDPSDYESTMEPHARGSILVAAVFEAFINTYKHEVADLLRIATDGTGVLRQGELHPDLVNRLAQEAAHCSQRVLNMCIRALDYCPPVDLTFGDYLRGIITADIDLKGEDQAYFRLAFIDAFRRRGIYPKGIKTLSIDSLAYPLGVLVFDSSQALFGIIIQFLREYRNEVISSRGTGAGVQERERIYHLSEKYAAILNIKLSENFAGSPEFQRITGIAWVEGWQDVGVSKGRNGPAFMIQNLRLVSRANSRGKMVNNIVCSLIQRAGVSVDADGNISYSQLRKSDSPPQAGGDQPGEKAEVMTFRGGCTMVFDLDTLDFKYVIPKFLVDVNTPDNEVRLDRERILAQHRYQYEDGPLAMSPMQQCFSQGFTNNFLEPFAMLHQH